MIYLIFVLSCMVAGISTDAIYNVNRYEEDSQACSNDHCKDRVLAYKLMEVAFLPNKEDLEEICPRAMTFFECERAFMECPGQTLDELTTSSDKTEASKAKATLGGISLVRDLCDEDSPFHTDYISSVSCYIEFFKEAAGTCQENTTKPLQDFFGQLYPNADEEGISEEVQTEIRCLEQAYQLVCIIDSLGDFCGNVAQRTARNALERMKGALGVFSCNYLENATDLKTRFLDFLELDEERRSSVQGIFDLFKRRR